MSNRKGVIVELAQRIKAAREKSGLSTQQLGERVDLSAQQIRRIESAESEITAIDLARIARAVRVDIRAFVDHVKNVEEIADSLWDKHKLSKQLAGSRQADFKAKKAILEAMGLWEE